MVERGGLENRCAPWGHRGFESLSLRKVILIPPIRHCPIGGICILYPDSQTVVASLPARFDNQLQLFYI